jgi:hypothetical protein
MGKATKIKWRGKNTHGAPKGGHSKKEAAAGKRKKMGR